MKVIAAFLSNARICQLIYTLLLGMCAFSANHAWAASCHIIPISRMHVSDSPQGPVTAGILDGHKIKVLIDTGSFKSMIVVAAAIKAGLHPVQSSYIRLLGVDGERAAETVDVKQLKFGSFVIKNRTLMATSSRMGNIGLVLGADVLSGVDVEIDLEHHKMIFWQPHHCAHTALAYWTRHYLAVPLTHRSNYYGGDRFGLNVMIDGKPVRAILDTGTNKSTMTIGTARSLGFDDKHAQEYETLHLASGKQIPVYKAAFDSFAMGPITVKHPRFLVSDLRRATKFKSTGSRIKRRRNAIPNLLIGTDFLRADHVYIANSQHMLYFTYNGGQMFQRGPQ